MLSLKRKDNLGLIPQIGEIIMSICHYFKAYEIYCVNHPAAMEFLKSQRHNSELNSFLQVWTILEIHQSRLMNLTLNSSTASRIQIIKI